MLRDQHTHTQQRPGMAPRREVLAVGRELERRKEMHTQSTPTHAHVSTPADWLQYRLIAIDVSTMYALQVGELLTLARDDGSLTVEHKLWSMLEAHLLIDARHETRQLVAGLAAWSDAYWPDSHLRAAWLTAAIHIEQQARALHEYVHRQCNSWRPAGESLADRGRALLERVAAVRAVLETIDEDSDTFWIVFAHLRDLQDGAR
jgi:hypothetical protein